MKPLSTIDIRRKLKQDSFSQIIFKEVLPRDLLPSKVKYPSAYVINTHPSTRIGEHWLAIYYDENGQCSFFDSFGNSPKFYNLESFLNKTSKNWIFNNKQLQSFFSAACGYYCIYFIMLLCRGFSLNNVVELFTQKNFDLNDFMISFI